MHASHQFHVYQIKWERIPQAIPRLGLHHYLNQRWHQQYRIILQVSRRINQLQCYWQHKCVFCHLPCVSFVASCLLLSATSQPYSRTFAYTASMFYLVSPLFISFLLLFRFVPFFPLIFSRIALLCFLQLWSFPFGVVYSCCLSFWKFLWHFSSISFQTLESTRPFEHASTYKEFTQ